MVSLSVYDNLDNKRKIVNIYLDGLYDPKMPVWFYFEPAIKKARKKLNVASDCPIRPIEVFPTSCGQCLECRIAKSKDWAIRAACECQYSNNTYFLTLTYNDEHLPIKRTFDSTTGEIVKEAPTVVKKHLQDFNNKLNMHCTRHYDQPIRKFCCGEYGEQTQRPHYHGIYYNLPLPDLEPYFSKNGNVYYRSAWLDQYWGKGNCAVSEVSFDVCNYVAGYVVKKWTGKGAKEHYEELGVDPEFHLYPNRCGGLGSQYYLDHKDEIYANDEIILPGKGKAQVSKPPAYFDYLAKKFEDIELEPIKLHRKLLANTSTQQMLSNTDLSYREILEARDRNLKDKYKKRKKRDGYNTM